MILNAGLREVVSGLACYILKCEVESAAENIQEKAWNSQRKKQERSGI